MLNIIGNASKKIEANFTTSNTKPMQSTLEVINETNKTKSMDTSAWMTMDRRWRTHAVPQEPLAKYDTSETPAMDETTTFLETGAVSTKKEPIFIKLHTTFGDRPLGIKTHLEATGMNISAIGNCTKSGSQ